jgi:hypothetical protein
MNDETEIKKLPFITPTVYYWNNDVAQWRYFMTLPIDGIDKIELEPDARLVIHRITLRPIKNEGTFRYIAPLRRLDFDGSGK